MVVQNYLIVIPRLFMELQWNLIAFVLFMIIQRYLVAFLHFKLLIPLNQTNIKILKWMIKLCTMTDSVVYKWYLVALLAALGVVGLVAGYADDAVLSGDEAHVANRLVALTTSKALLMPLFALVLKLFHSWNTSNNIFKYKIILFQIVSYIFKFVFVSNYIVWICLNLDILMVS